MKDRAAMAAVAEAHNTMQSEPPIAVIPAIAFLSDDGLVITHRSCCSAE